MFVFLICPSRMFRNVSAVFGRFDSDEPGIKWAAAKATLQGWFFSAVGSSIMKERPFLTFTSCFHPLLRFFWAFKNPGKQGVA